MPHASHFALMVAAAMPFATGCFARPEVVLRLGGSGTPELHCFVEVDGTRIATEDFAAYARRWRHRSVRLTFAGDTPYRCVGGVIFNLQRAGVRDIAVTPPATNQ